MTQRQKDSALAAAVTFAALLLLLLFLFLGRLRWDRGALAAESIPETGQEEVFLEPELLEQPGQEAEVQEAAAPQQGEPDPAPVENHQVAERQPEPVAEPAPTRQVTQKDPSPVKEAKTRQEEEPRKATSPAAGKFNKQNGSTEGRVDSQGVAGASSVLTAGSLNGRTFLGCPPFEVTLSNRTVVKVMVTVDAEGNVTSAQATGGASADIRSRCEAAARKARWSPKKGAAQTRGSITFTITPR